LVNTKLIGDLKSLTGRSLVYGIGSIVLKGLSFLLIPLYTRYLSTTDYGIIAITGSVITVLSIIFSLELRGSIAYFYFNANGEQQRRRTNGSIWLAMVMIALIMAILAELNGCRIFGLIYKEIPYQPYFRMAVWTAFFLIFAQMPMNLFQVREKPVYYITLTVISTLLNLVLVIFFVVIRKMGAYGYLLGSLLSAALMIVPYSVIALRQISFAFDWKIIKSVLLYSLPLVPHSLSAWILDLSDRSILEKFVPMGDIGIYSLGSQFGSLIALIASAINFAWVPFIFRLFEQDPENASKRIASLVTYYVLFLSFICLGLELFVRDILQFMAAPAYHAAYLVTYWVLAGQFLTALYYIPVNFLFLKKKTQWIPLITITSGIVDIGLNFLLIPQYGYLAAAWAGVISKIFMLVIVFVLTLRIIQIPYEYRRVALMIGWMVCIVFIGMLMPSYSEITHIFVGLFLIIAYPVGLIVFGFLNDHELLLLRKLFPLRQAPL
jgi:O-antigen/teichoic acid export membrane protein